MKTPRKGFKQMVDEAKSRMAAQATRERRLAVADLVIDNDGPLEALEPQVRKVWERLRGA